MARTGSIARVLVAAAVAAGGLWPSALFAQAAQAPQPAPKFERMEDSPYLVLYWNCKKTDAGALVMEGLAEIPFPELGPGNRDVETMGTKRGGTARVKPASRREAERRQMRRAQARLQARRRGDRKGER